MTRRPVCSIVPSPLQRKGLLSIGLVASAIVFFLPFLASAQSFQAGFDFRNTSTFVTDPAGDTYVLPTTAYPTKSNGVTFGWVNTTLVGGRDRNASLDPRLAGINFANNGSPATFYVDLPSAGTYNLSLAMGDANFPRCVVQCEIQFLDGQTVLATVEEGPIPAGYFYDAKGNQWSAAAWPSSNVSQPVTLTGTRLTVVVGLSQNNGEITALAFLGVTQVSAWQQGFDFRNTSTFVTDPAGDTGVLPTTAYPTKSNGVTFGWVNTSLVQARDRNAALD